MWCSAVAESLARPLIAAALRWTDQRAEVDPLTGEVHVDERSSSCSEADRCALEHALRISAVLNGSVLAVTVGPAGSDDLLRDALAVGAHAVLRVDPGHHEDLAADDGAATAYGLLDAVTACHGSPDLVLCGDHSSDRGTGSTPAYLAHRLGGAQALGLLELEADDGSLRALRRLDGGRRERLAVPLPAVCSVEPTTVRLRRAPLPAVLAARSAQIPVVHAPARVPFAARVGSTAPYRPRARELPAPAGDDPRNRMLALTGALVERTPPRVVRPETPAAAADELLGFLRQHGYLDP